MCRSKSKNWIVLAPAARLAIVIALLLSNVSPAAAQPAWTGVMTTVSGEPASSEIELAGDAAGNAVAIWKALDSSIRVAHFSAVTKAWGAPVTLQLNGYSPDVAMNSDGDAMAVWYQEANSVRAARYQRLFGDLGGPVTIGTGILPQVAVDPRGNATAVWQAFGSTSGSHVQAARYSTATGVWSAAVDITPVAYNGGLASQPNVVVDASGHATAVFWTGIRLSRWAGAIYQSLACEQRLMD